MRDKVGFKVLFSTCPTGLGKRDNKHAEINVLCCWSCFSGFRVYGEGAMGALCYNVQGNFEYLQNLLAESSH